MIVMRGREAGRLVTEIRHNTEAIEQLRGQLAGHQAQHDTDKQRVLVARRWYARTALAALATGGSMIVVAIDLLAHSH